MRINTKKTNKFFIACDEPTCDALYEYQYTPDYYRDDWGYADGTRIHYCPNHREWGHKYAAPEK